MRRLAGCLVLWLIVLAQGAAAGPWPRDPGAVFLSFSVEQDRDNNRYSSLYAEYGLGPHDTLGMELGHSNGEASALVWWQRALGRPAGPNRWTISLGLGAIRREGRLHPLGQLGAAWGRSFDTLPLLRHVPGGGWLAIEARSKLAAITREFQAQPNVIYEDPTYLTPEATHKAELTLGWHAMDKLTLTGQFRFEDRDDTGFSSKLAVTAVRELWGPAKLELGVIVPLSRRDETAVKLGTWFAF